MGLVKLEWKSFIEYRENKSQSILLRKKEIYYLESL